MGCWAMVLALVLVAGTAMAAPPLLFPQRVPRIAVDPGHGGRDGGAKGPTGHLEKTIALELARRLALALEPRYEVVLTRSDDFSVAQRQRTAIANQNKADLLISLHTGAAFLHAAKGMTVFYHTPHQRAEAGTGAQTPAAQATWHDTQLRHQAASIALATALKTQLEQISGACKIQSAPLVVLEGADMPALIIEVGHITHPATENKLASEAYLDQLANAIGTGIDQYINAANASDKP